MMLSSVCCKLRLGQSLSLAHLRVCASPLNMCRNVSSNKDTSKEKFQIFQWGAFLTFAGLVIGGGMYLSRDLQQAKQKTSRSYGRPAIGGDFNLIDSHGKPCSLADFRGKWVLLYFGFCRCPDICPEQLERMVEVFNRIMLLTKPKHPLVPVFVTVDYERDTPGIVNEYVKEFSPHMIGLTGTKEEVEKVTKLYRIYFSSGPKDVEGDYLVDHTVIIYLLNPNGDFSDYYGQSKPVPEMVDSIMQKMKEFDS